MLLAIPDIELADAQINALNSLYAYAAEKNIAVSIATVYKGNIIKNLIMEIYLYDNKLIFTGTRDLYFEKYKGNGPGVYSQPILCLPSSCSISEIQQALLTCVGVLEQNEKKILDENTSNSVTQMESVLFRNFKSFGIKASKSKIIKSSIMIMIRMNEKPLLCRCVPEGRDMVIQREISLTTDAQPAEIAQRICDLLELT